MKKFQQKYPRTWGLLMIAPMIFITLIVYPLCGLYDLFRHIRQALSNLWEDLGGWYYPFISQGYETMLIWKQVIIAIIKGRIIE